MNNLELMRKRLEWQGGIRQEDRMIKDKWRTLQRALQYSYQACTVQMVQKSCQVLNADSSAIDKEFGIFPVWRALINPDKVKQDYDDKIISIDHMAQYEPGDVFEWKRTGTHWIIYLEEVTEDAYFRGEIRRCRYKIKFKDQDGNWCETYAAIRGPVETQIESIQKNQIRIDKPNLSLNILMPRNEKTVYAFDRYKEFLLDGRCWKVQAPDGISMSDGDNNKYGVLEINAEEDYINRDTDDIENQMKDGLIIEPEDPTPESGIIGETFIKPMIQETYSVEEANGDWSILEKNIPVTICPSGNKSIQITWNKTTHGQFTLIWKKGQTILEKVIVVESLF